MKVTKGQPKQEDKKVIAFYTGDELVFCDRYGTQNFVLSTQNAIYASYMEFDEYLNVSRTLPGFIAFYEGDTIIIEL